MVRDDRFLSTNVKTSYTDSYLKTLCLVLPFSLAERKFMLIFYVFIVRWYNLIIFDIIIWYYFIYNIFINDPFINSCNCLNFNLLCCLFEWFLSALFGLYFFMVIVSLFDIIMSYNEFYLSFKVLISFVFKPNEF